MLSFVARGKDAYIRVGGGQPWSDVYNAVSSSKEKGDLSKAYGVGGGAAGSVGSAGGWLSGGKTISQTQPISMHMRI